MNSFAFQQLPAHLAQLESESIRILRECLAEARRPVLLFSGGKDSTVLVDLVLRAVFPAKPSIPLLHIDSTWEFAELLAFRDRLAVRHGFRLHVHRNDDGRRRGINPFDHGDDYTSVMRTQPLKEALDAGRYDVILGGARRDEEASRAKERIVSLRDRGHAWDPRRQRPELWETVNLRLGEAQSARVFPLSNWTELDILTYAYLRRLELAPLYFAKVRPTVERDGTLLVVEDETPLRLQPHEHVTWRCVRFRTLGCWPLTGAIASEATDLGAVLVETLQSTRSERNGRLGDRDSGGTLEQQKRAGYF